MADSGDRDRFLIRIKGTVDYCCRLSESDSIDDDLINNIDRRLDVLYRDVERSVDDLLTSDEATDFMETIDKLKNEIKCKLRISHKDSQYQSVRVPIDERGHSRYNVQKEQLDYLSTYGFTAPMMSEVLGISESTVRRRLRKYNIKLRKNTVITDSDLDEKVKEIIRTNRLIGPNSVRARLSREKILVTRQRVRESCARIDPAGCSLRSVERKNIQRRTYKVAGPNSLWHIDGNHKLIRWQMVIHGGIDGFSRMVTFLSINSSDNNRSITVFDKFSTASKEFGLPSRIRCDHGVENRDVCLYMEGVRGEGRGSAIRGKSAHNQRIERLWVDVWDNVSSEYYDLFTYMESQNILDVSNEKHIYAVHFVFLPRINESLKSFKFQYNNHPLSTEHYQTPSQLFIKGVLLNANSNLTAIQELILNSGGTEANEQSTVQSDIYGIDDNDDDIDELIDSSANPDILANNVEIDEETKRQLTSEIDPMENCRCLEYGVELFNKTLRLIQQQLN